MAPLFAALITGVIGALASEVLPLIKQRGTGAQPVRRRRVRRMAGPFSWTWRTALFVGLVSGLAVFLTHAPTRSEMRQDAFQDFFSTSAQITAALIVALAIEAVIEDDPRASDYKLEGCLCVGLAAVAAVGGLIPDLPHWVYASALSIVPAGLIGGLVGVILVAANRRGKRLPVEGPAEDRSRAVRVPYDQFSSGSAPPPRAVRGRVRPVDREAPGS